MAFRLGGSGEPAVREGERVEQVAKAGAPFREDDRLALACEGIVRVLSGPRHVGGQRAEDRREPALQWSGVRGQLAGGEAVGGGHVAEAVVAERAAVGGDRIIVQAVMVVERAPHAAGTAVRVHAGA